MPTIGVDEAGRGPVLGPLVVAAVLVESERPLRKLGVKDSKLLSPARREELAPAIRQLATRVELRIIHADELNARMPTENLNEIEVDAFAELLRRLCPEPPLPTALSPTLHPANAPLPTAILDACDVDADRFGRNVAARLPHPIPIQARHEADARHPAVAAASILAKVERDRLMTDICATYGECGSGYAHDERTQEWLATYVREHDRLPPIARREWETSRRLLQRDLTTILGLPPPKKPQKAPRRSRAQ